LLCILLSGCAKDLVCSTKPTFFPPPPNDPRIQWLTGITSSVDIGAKESQSSFSFFLSGREQPDIIRKIGKANGIVAHDNKLYIAETVHSRVTIIDPVNGTWEYLKGLSNPKGVLKAPANLAFDGDGNLYVADTERKEIVVYDKAGNYLNAFGKELEKGSRIVGVGVYQDRLYALDLGTSLIRILDRKTGEQIKSIGYIDKPNQSLRLPGYFTFDNNGAIYVTNTGNNKVMKYDIDGNFLGSFGGIGDRAGNFVRPRGINVDDAGRIFVVDGGFNTVSIFDDKFRLLTFFGWPGLETGSLNLPSGIAVTKENLGYFQKYAVPGFQLESLIFVVNQYGQEACIPRISVYGLGQMQGKKDDNKTPPDAAGKK
jgi:DNA-binding beta-propeller fold protein YncE